MNHTNNIITANEEVAVPDDFICPLSLNIMKDPVISKYGNSFERREILQWLSKHSTDPLTRRHLRLTDLITDYKLLIRIRQWQKDNEQEIVIACNTPETEDNYLNSDMCYGFIDVSQVYLDKLERRGLLESTERTEDNTGSEGGSDAEFSPSARITEAPAALPRRQGLRQRLRRAIARSSRS